MSRRLGWMILTLAVAAPLTAHADKPTLTKEKAAEEAALAWLGQVDAGQYGASWEGAASLFQAAVSKDQWAQMVAAVRTPLGKLKSRKLLTATYTTSAPGAPDGHYVILKFAAVFSKKAAAVETVTPLIDKDGRWHVSGYFIK